MRISEVIRRKGDVVITIHPDATVAHLLTLMDENRIGAVVVSVDGGVSLAGIVSERDVVRELHRQGAGVLEATVATLMTSDVEVCVPEDHVDTLAMRMTELRVRHVPVVVDGELKAIVSIGDIVKNRIDELQAERDQLVDYVRR